MSVTLARTEGKLRVLLVCMPWANLDMPSLALSTIAPIVEERSELVDVRYANLLWVEHLHQHSSGAISERDYEKISGGEFLGVGEWVFSGALYGDDRDAESTSFYQLASAEGVDLEAPCEMYRMAPEFVRMLAKEIAAQGPDLIGLTSTFDQNIPSLALAKELKAVDPGIITLLGGANCDGLQGAALHRNFAELDYVVRGEAELVLPELLGALGDYAATGDRAARKARLGEISGLCWRPDPGQSAANDLSRRMVQMNEVPTPRYDHYFEAFEQSEACEHLIPVVTIEGGRGCWWGEKHHCTFCGLNGTLMEHRSKSPERLLDEIKQIVRDYQTLDLVFTDNILDMGHLKKVIPELADLEWDLRFFFEVKSNLTCAKLLDLADAGVTQIQPGIENLSSRVLKIMRKGVSGWQNIRFLRDCRTLAIFPSWNMLYGFPGEEWHDYSPIVDQMPNIVHLFPPAGTNRIVLTRFSPYFDDRDLGLASMGPSRFLSATYRLPREELEDLVYAFDSEDAGITPGEADQLLARVAGWIRDHPAARLVALEHGDELRVIDQRRPSDSREYTIRGAAEVAAYRGLLKGRTMDALGRALRDEGHGFSSGALCELVESWVANGLVFSEDDHYVALATGLEW